MDFILKFSEKLPELFLKATPDEKKLIISTRTKSIIFDGENLKIKLKDTFKALQDVNNFVKIDLRTPNLRTQSNASISIKNDLQGVDFINGAGCGSFLELFNKTLQPVLSSAQMLIIYSEIENYFNGVEN